MKKIYITIAIILLAISLFMPYFLTLERIFDFDFSTTGQIGDTIGGITAPFINIAAAILVYLSFKEQIKANKYLSKESSLNYIYNLYDKAKQNNEEFKNKHENMYYKYANFYLQNIINGRELDSNILKTENLLTEVDSNLNNHIAVIQEIEISKNFSPIVAKNLIKEILITIENDFEREFKPLNKQEYKESKMLSKTILELIIGINQKLVEFENYSFSQ